MKVKRNGKIEREKKNFNRITTNAHRRMSCSYVRGGIGGIPLIVCDSGVAETHASHFQTLTNCFNFNLMKTRKKRVKYKLM